MLAENVETQTDFFRARDQGFVYFQGYFFRLGQHGESDLFLLGLLSLIDAMLEMPMADVLKRFHLITKPRRC